MKTEVIPFFCPMDKIMISPFIETCILKSPSLCTIFFSKQAHKIITYGLCFSRSYFEFWDNEDYFHFYAQTLLWELYIS